MKMEMKMKMKMEMEMEMETEMRGRKVEKETGRTVRFLLSNGIPALDNIGVLQLFQFAISARQS